VSDEIRGYRPRQEPGSLTMLQNFSLRGRKETGGDKNWENEKSRPYWEQVNPAVSPLRKRKLKKKWLGQKTGHLHCVPDASMGKWVEGVRRGTLCLGPRQDHCLNIYTQK